MAARHRGSTSVDSGVNHTTNIHRFNVSPHVTHPWRATFIKITSHCTLLFRNNKAFIYKRDLIISSACNLSWMHSVRSKSLFGTDRNCFFCRMLTVFSGTTERIQPVIYFRLRATFIRNVIKLAYWAVRCSLTSSKGTGRSQYGLMAH
jgi:hypothetical protein